MRKYLRFLIVILFLLLVVIMPYPFQKSGLGSNLNYGLLFLFIGLLSFFVSLLFKNIGRIESVFLALIVGAVSFLVSTFIIPHFENLFHGDYTRFFWETKNRILINFIFYSIYLLFVFILCRTDVSICKKK